MKPLRIFVLLQQIIISVNGIVSGNKIKIKIPPINHIFEPGLYNCYLEIILENRVFVPFNEQIKITNSVQKENKEIKRKKKNNENHYIFEGFKNPFRKH